MDLLDWDSVINATKDIDFVLHVANPVGMKGSDDFFIKPAVEGTVALLEGSKMHGVKWVIVTSSMATIFDENLKPDIVSEENNNVIYKKTSSYAKSKIL